MGFKRGFFLFAFLLCAQGAWAATICERFLVQASAVASSKRYDLVQGEPVKLQLGDDPALSDVVFLGRLVTIDGVSRELAFYDSAKKLLHIVPVSKLSIQREGGEALSADKTPPVVRSINQEGGTCAAFSIFNCMRQLHYVLGKKGSEALQKQLDNEQGRTGLLARVVNKVYIENHDDLTVLADLVKTYDLEYAELGWSEPDELKSSVRKNLAKGWPVLIRFDVPHEMSETPYTIIDQATGEPLTRKLWTPKKWLQRRKGGHMVLALGVFEVNGERKILVTDPNWQAPRLWDLDELDKAKGASIRAFVVWQAPKPAQP